MQPTKELLRIMDDLDQLHQNSLAQGPRLLVPYCVMVIFFESCLVLSSLWILLFNAEAATREMVAILEVLILKRRGGSSKERIVDGTITSRGTTLNFR